MRSTGDLVLATVSGGVVTNLLAADQFLSIALPGRLFTVAYDERGLDRLNLSRTLEGLRDVDIGTGSLEHLRCVHECHPRHCHH